MIGSSVMKELMLGKGLCEGKESMRKLICNSVEGLTTTLENQKGKPCLCKYQQRSYQFFKILQSNLILKTKIDLKHVIKRH